MRLILVRHPQPACETGLCYGRLDLECDPGALNQAVTRFRDVAPGHCIVSSPARRALDLAQQLSADPIIEPRLQELHFGEWEGRRWQELGPEQVEEWQRGLPDSAPPNGETLTSLGGRCGSWLAGLSDVPLPVLAITHAGPIRVIIAILRGEPLLTHFKTAIPFGESISLEVPKDFCDNFLRSRIKKS